MTPSNPYFVNTAREYPRRQKTEYSIPFIFGAICLLCQIFAGEVFRVDRFQHMGLSCLLFLLTFHILVGHQRRILVSFIVVAALGLFKEWGDHQAEALDILANLVGLGAGVLIGLSMEALFQDRRLTGGAKRKAW